MNWKDYLKDRWIYICLFAAVFAGTTIFGILIMIPKIYILFAEILYTALWICIWGIDYFRKYRFYNRLEDSLKNLDQKYLLAELLEEPEFLEGRILYEILKDMTGSMIQRIRVFQHSSKEYKEYIELWVHEVKLPIATGKMIVENNPGPSSESIGEELDKIDAYTEQALFYARSNYVEKDYILKRINLEELIYQVIRKNKKEILGKNVAVNLHDLKVNVYSDGKWLGFILKQILDNSLKYVRKTKREIEWYALEKKENVELHLKDNGIGITAEDIGRVFEKGFTGRNGRQGQKSTGIGLYLCRKLCEKMGHGIRLQAEEGNGCEIIITFPRGSMTEYLT